MFKYDLVVINWIYNNCKMLGNVFGYGAFEGFIIYTGIIIVAVTSVINKRLKNVC
ncbi:hypothetical protein NNC19_07115 [Clostridium sp. SHJSY1]|uniref:hypothetical protein n=1 Tax=Clostridium sp. SHJSY1 TaxID=2942483 RepID=UPI002876EA5B|nr:hypothetical protein [Clostridium sp. SHJSY1]MDS0525443.1 hypothetical protein [Clostridium sp. SHJSY1]